MSIANARVFDLSRPRIATLFFSLAIDGTCAQQSLRRKTSAMRGANRKDGKREEHQHANGADGCAGNKT